MTLNPIETRYASCRFRSRLEARWAVVFDTLGISWQYEPEGFHLPPLDREHPARHHWSDGRSGGVEPRPGVPGPDDDAGWYLPDFHLDGIGWFEVKGRPPDPVQSARLDRFSLLADERLHVAVGSIPNPSTLTRHGHAVPWNQDDFDIDIRCDHHYALCVCHECSKVGLEFDARGARICRHDADDKAYSGDHPTIIDAYSAGRQARFDRGRVFR